MTELVAKMKHLKEDGRKILGCFPLYPPVELFHSMGLTPVVLWGLNKFFAGKTDSSDRHLQSYTCSVARYMTEFVLSDPGTMLDGMFTYNACDTLRNLPEVLQSGLRDSGKDLPFAHIHIPMAPRGQTESSRYMRNEISALVEDLKGTFGCEFSAGTFQHSVELYKEARALSKAFQETVVQGRASFSDFVDVIQGNYFLPVEEQVHELKAALRDPDLNEGGKSDDSSSGRVVLSGITDPPTALCDIIEASGLRIVGNDIASMARSYDYTPDEFRGPEDYYEDLYANHHPCTTLLHTGDARPTKLLGLIERTKADGFIFLGEKFCEYEYFEFPFIEKTLRDHGIHTLALEFALGDEGNIGAYRTRIQAFAELVGTPA
jgi:benzoyl-CoA reductase/2-hydroxyglutaryl-CoA dehydratase subunit BcrC/BadD/HgdB